MHKDGNRPRRVAALLKRELAAAIRDELDAPGAAGITVTAVDVAPDLKSAKVYVSHLQGHEVADDIISLLRKSAGYLRHCLAERVQLRGVPALKFVFDESLERGDRIGRLLDAALKDSGGNQDH